MVTFQPAAPTIARGESASFSLGATGSGPLTYQWYRDGQPIAGATRPVLTLDRASESDAGDYSVEIANALGRARSNAATLTVNPPVPLAITSQPAGGVLFNGENLTLSVAVTGSGPIAYQWRHNGSPIAQATGSHLTLVGFTYSLAANVGTYDVVVTAPYSTVTSEPATVAWGGPVISVAPNGPIDAAAGETITITASATGDEPLSYRWTRTLGGLDVSTPTLQLSNLSPADSGAYTIEVTDANGHSNRVTFLLDVSAATPLIETPPASQAVVPGGRVTLHVGVTSPEFYSYQWRRNGVDIAGATQADFTIEAFGPDDAGDYDVIISGSGVTSITTAAATLSVSSSRLVNLSTRAVAGDNDDTLIQGFVLRGDPSPGAPDVLVRTVGPTLETMGVSGVLANPSLRVLDRRGAVLAENDDWATMIPTGRGIAATAAQMAASGRAFATRGSAARWKLCSTAAAARSTTTTTGDRPPIWPTCARR